MASHTPSGKGGCRRIRNGGIGTERDSHGHSFLARPVFFKEMRPILVKVPVHASRPVIVDLHTVHPPILGARIKILCAHDRKGEKTSPISWPAL